MVDFKHSNFLLGRPADLIVHTRDLETFFAHRVVLAFTSEKLASLVRVSTNGAIYFPEEPSGAVCSLLEWIYPHTSMRIANFGALDAALSIAKKYQLDAMRDALQSMLRQPDSPVNLRKDPILAYSIATTHGLTSDAQEAARLAVGAVDFRRPRVLEELTERGVSVECAFRLVQKQFAWECALADGLLRTSTSSGGNLILEEREWKRLVCAECTSWAEDAGPMGMVQWQRNWAERVYERLLCTPLEDCVYLFRSDYVTRVWNGGCERCMIRLMRDQDMLDAWISRVWKMVNRKWEEIFVDPRGKDKEQERINTDEDEHEHKAGPRPSTPPPPVCVPTTSIVAPQTPPCTIPKRGGQTARDTPLRDSPNNPFLVEHSGPPVALRPRPKRRAVDFTEGPTVGYVFRGVRTSFANPHANQHPPSPTLEPNHPSFLPLEHPDFSPSELARPQLLFPQAHGYAQRRESLSAGTALDAEERTSQGSQDVSEEEQAQH
ncbi:hypothetical protein FRC10_008947 [Ceratobasidium sp. 414]|nr:hypothetical protein FRC10_008947 [Ceratobasidium sp. 414]